MGLSQLFSSYLKLLYGLSVPFRLLHVFENDQANFRPRILAACSYETLSDVLILPEAAV